jgi:hypothetical protein
MPAKREPTRDDLRKEEREIGANIPEGMKGEDDSDSARGVEKRGDEKEQE